MQYILPEFEPCIGFLQKNKYHSMSVDKHIFTSLCISPTILTVRLALLLHDIGKPYCMKTDKDNQGHFFGHDKLSAIMAKKILQRLKYDNYTKKRVFFLIDEHHREINKKNLKKMLSKFGKDALYELIQVKLADAKSKQTEFSQALVEKLLLLEKDFDLLVKSMPAISIKDLKVNGRDLINIGFKGNKNLGNTLKILLDIVIQDETKNNREELLKIALNYLK